MRSSVRPRLAPPVFFPILHLLDWSEKTSLGGVYPVLRRAQDEIRESVSKGPGWQVLARAFYLLKLPRTSRMAVIHRLCVDEFF